MTPLQPVKYNNTIIIIMQCVQVKSALRCYEVKICGMCDLLNKIHFTKYYDNAITEKLNTVDCADFWDRDINIV